MNADLSTPVLLRRLTQMEATVGRISHDLGNLRAVMRKQSSQPQASQRPRSVRAEANTNANRQPVAVDGLAGAVARGEAARVQWVKQGVVVPGEQLAQAWGLTRQALAPAAQRGEVFAVKVGNRLYYPQSFLVLDRQSVAGICVALGALGVSEKLTFWLREHGALGGRSVAAALDEGVAVTKLERLAAAWARERAGVRGA
jgi:hypothetical protein